MWRPPRPLPSKPNSRVPPHQRNGGEAAGLAPVFLPRISANRAHPGCIYNDANVLSGRENR